MDEQEVVKEVGYIGARLREKSTYGGLAVAVGLALPLINKYFPNTPLDVQTVVNVLSDAGLAVGIIIGIFLPEKKA